MPTRCHKKEAAAIEKLQPTDNCTNVILRIILNNVFIFWIIIKNCFPDRIS